MELLCEHNMLLQPPKSPNEPHQQEVSRDQARIHMLLNGPQYHSYASFSFGFSATIPAKTNPKDTLGLSAPVHCILQ